MPTLESAGPGTATSVLEETILAVSVVDTPELGRAQRIIVSYTLTTQENDTFVHMYEFYTDDFDEGGSAWGEFIQLITGDSNDESLIYHAKRNGGVMYEFTDLCLEEKQQAAAA